MVDGVVQLGAGAQVGGQGGVHGADALGEPAPPGQVNDRVGDGRGVGAGCVEQVAQAGAAMALKQCRARPGLAEPEALHSPGEAAHQGQSEPHGRRWAEQDDVAAGLGHRGPDEGHVPQVRPGLRPLLGGHIGPRGDAGESRACEQAGCPGHDRIGGEEQRQRWCWVGTVRGAGAFEGGGTHASHRGAMRGRRRPTSSALWRGLAPGDLWHPEGRRLRGLSTGAGPVQWWAGQVVVAVTVVVAGGILRVRGHFLPAGDVLRVRGRDCCPRRRRMPPAAARRARPSGMSPWAGQGGAR